MRAAKALVCADFTEPSLLTDAINNEISCTELLRNKNKTILSGGLPDKYTDS